MFWLTGGTLTEFKGFSNNPARPLSPAKPFGAGREPEKRKGPFMEVNGKKFTNAKSGVMDGRLRDPWGTPYAVLGAIRVGQDYHPEVTYADFEDPTNKLTAYFTATGYYNKGGVQIISAGPNRRFGPGGKYTPGADEWATSKTGGDDLANFKKDQLSADGD